MIASPSRPLTPTEARVLGVLVEKAATVPDSYPMSLNALLGGCNQKTARDPVLALTEGEVQDALAGLRALHLAHEVSGSRVVRHEHNAPRGLALPSAAVALLATLALRGPQTVSELRANCERLHRFADVSSVEGFLEELAERSDEKGGPLAIRLARAPGAREARWTHLLCGPVDPGVEPPMRAESSGGTGARPDPFARLEAIQRELDELRRRVDALEEQRPHDASS